METRDVSNWVVAMLLVAAIVALVALAQGTPDHAPRPRRRSDGGRRNLLAVTIVAEGGGTHDRGRPTGRNPRPARAVVPRCADPGHRARRPHPAHDHHLRDGRHRRAAAGRPPGQRGRCRAGGVQERPYRGPRPGSRHRWHLLRPERGLHPAGRRRAHRRVEHGGHHPDRRLLRRRAAERGPGSTRPRPSSAAWSGCPSAARGPPPPPWAWRSWPSHRWSAPTRSSRPGPSSRARTSGTR